MTRQEHLLTCLAEEAAEIQQAVSKALRFGLDDGYPGTDRTNAEDIAKEIIDFLSIVELLTEARVLPVIPSMKAIEAKKEKVRQYMEYAKDRGTLSA